MTHRRLALLIVGLATLGVAAGCGAEDTLRADLIRAGDGDPFAAATTIEVDILGTDPTAPALEHASFGVGGKGSFTGKIPYGAAGGPATLRAVARGLAANGSVVARGGSRAYATPAGSGHSLDLSFFVAATASFYTTFDATTGAKTGPDSGIPGLSATRLSDGQVLVVGGTRIDATGNITDIADTAYLYDSDTGIYRKLTAHLQNPRAYHSATALRSTAGNPSPVLLCGGLTLVNNQLVSAATCEVYNSATESFTIVSQPMSKPRVGHAAVLLPDTRVLLAGGADIAKISLPCSTCTRDGLVYQTVHDSADAFVQDTMTITTITTATKKMRAPRAFHIALRANSNGRVLLAGGEDETTTLDSTEIFTPDTNAFDDGPTLDDPRTRTAAVRLSNDNVCLFGGLRDSHSQTAVLNTYECYAVGDLDHGTKAAAGLTFASRRDECAVLLSTGSVLLVGGFDSNGSGLATAELVTPGGAAAASAGVPAAARALHACATLGSGGASGWEAVLVVGGVDVDSGGLWTNQPSGEVYTP